MDVFLDTAAEFLFRHAAGLAAPVIGTLLGLVAHQILFRVVIRTRAERRPEEPIPEEPEPEGPGPEVPGPEVPGPEVPGPEVPGPEVPGPEGPVPGAPGPEAPIGPRGKVTFARYCRRPAAWTLPLLGAVLALSASPVSGPGWHAVSRILLVLLILGIAWLFMGLSRVATTAYLGRYDTKVTDNLEARKVHTQVEILRKITVVVIGVLAVSAIFMSFEDLRENGTGILASAGVVGLVIGLAAQRTLGNILAGVQIAITQPIRIDDVVIVEGEWGRIEEITLTYVVLRIWDERRLVVPISHFIEKPFQNWTRTSADILGSVYLYLDHRIPVEDLREQVGRLVESNEHWDGRVWRLHITDTTEKCVELRALMSAADSPSAWELRCAVREGLVEWVRKNHPDSLPRFRAEVDPGGREDPDGPGRPGGGNGLPARKGFDGTDGPPDEPTEGTKRSGGPDGSTDGPDGSTDGSDERCNGSKGSTDGQVDPDEPAPMGSPDVAA